MHLARKQIIGLNNTVMISQLKDLYSAAGNQYQIYSFTHNKEDSIKSIITTAEHGFEMPNSIALAFDQKGKILFCASNTPAQPIAQNEDEPSEVKDSAINEPFSEQNFVEGDSESKIEESKISGENTDKTQGEQTKPILTLDKYSTQFPDVVALEKLNQDYEAGINDGSLIFTSALGQYYGVYKFHEEWGCYFVRAELRSDTMKANVILFGIISIAIAIIVILFLVAGLFMFRTILENVNKITKSLYEMQAAQKLSTIDLSKSPNDDVTYLAASFNSLSSTINNLLSLFQKFVSKDVVAKAYEEHQIRLEGSQQNLVMLFSDIRSFTYRTETLGNDIIDLLNVHYDKVIHTVHEHTGVIGSIIGDAILAIYGTQPTKNKSLDALEAAWQITRVTANLRSKMTERRAQIEKKRDLTDSEQRIFEAVLIDIGVGLDGGNVFYGNIGSDEHMTNTVIGDNVNSASRLEGLTRIYQLPVIVSGYIKDEIEGAGVTKYKFYEIDTVQVKGKTEGKKIYFPMDTESSELMEDFDTYEQALQNYYKGDWDAARKLFKKCGIEAANVFLERIGNKSAPESWSGIWTMQTK